MVNTSFTKDVQFPPLPIEEWEDEEYSAPVSADRGTGRACIVSENKPLVARILLCLYMQAYYRAYSLLDLVFEMESNFKR
jgi:hypothetical protein